MGAVFSMFGGIYYWFDKITGVAYNEILGQIHFWIFFIGVNFTFFPMHFLGVAGMPRRVPDYPDAFYAYNKIASWGSYISAWSTLVFFFMLYEALARRNWTGPNFILHHLADWYIEIAYKIIRKGENPKWIYYFLFVGVFYVKRPLLTFTGYLVLVLLIFISITISRKFHSVGRVVSLFLMRNASPSVYTNWYEKGLLNGRSYIAGNSTLSPYHSTRVVCVGEVSAGKAIAGIAGKVGFPGVAEGGAKVAGAMGGAAAGDVSASAETASTFGGLEAEASSSTPKNYTMTSAELKDQAMVDVINTANAVGKAGAVVGGIVTGGLIAEHIIVNNENNQYRSDGEKKSALQSLLEAAYGNAAPTVPETPAIPDDSDKKGGSWKFWQKG
jgi:hypothetical protein